MLRPRFCSLSALLRCIPCALLLGFAIVSHAQAPDTDQTQTSGQDSSQTSGQDSSQNPDQDQTRTQDKNRTTDQDQTRTRDQNRKKTPPSPTNPLVGYGDKREGSRDPDQTPLRDYRVEPRKQRAPRAEQEIILPFGYHFFDAPRQVIEARRSYLRRLYGANNFQFGDENGAKQFPDDTLTPSRLQRTRPGETGKRPNGLDSLLPDRNGKPRRGLSSRSAPPTQEELDAVMNLTDEQRRDLLLRQAEGTLTPDEQSRYRLLLERRRSARSANAQDKNDQDSNLNSDAQDNNTLDRELQDNDGMDRESLDRDSQDQDGLNKNSQTRRKRNRAMDDSDQRDSDQLDSDERDSALTQRDRTGVNGRSASTRRRSDIPQLPDDDAYRAIGDPLAQLYQNVSASAPSNYQFSPGDTFLLRFSSATLETQEMNLTVDSTGGVTIPDVGHVIVRGQTPSQAEAALRQRMNDYYPGVQVSLSLKQMRTISITLSGESYMPGVYVVPAVTTAYNLLYATGGPSENGSWRRIELRRRGVLVATIDLYQFLISGQSAPDAPLESGDVVYVPGRFGQVSVCGDVRRPALYEMLNGETMQKALTYAGGILPSGVTQRVQLGTIAPGGARVLKDVDLSEVGNGKPVAVYDGDKIEVFSIRPMLTNKVTVEGAVDQPGDYALQPGMTVGDLVRRSRGLLSEAYPVRADLNRVNPDMTLTLIPINLERALAGDASANVSLTRWDRLTIYTRDQVAWTGRREVTVRGAVRKPGIYYRSANMRIKDLLLQAEGTLPNAAQLTLLHQRPDGTFAYQYPSLSEIIKPDSPQNYLVEDRDILAVYRNDEAQFTPDHKINIQGEVVTPGSYAYGEGMRLSDALRLAGGLTPRAGDQIQVASARKDKDQAPVLSRYAADGAVSPDLTLKDGDVIIIQGKENYQDTPAIVQIHGAVNHPGPVMLKGRAMRLADAIREAGGISPDGYPQGAELIRESSHLATAGQRQLALVISRINNVLNQSDYRRQLALSDIERIKASSNAQRQQPLIPAGIPGLTPDSPQPTDAALSQQGAQSLFAHQLVTTPRVLTTEDLEPQGNVAIDLASAMRKPTGDDNILLVDGDVITIPEKPTTVQVVGAVIQSRAVPYKPGAKLSYYVDQAGGLTKDAILNRGVLIRIGGGLMPLDKVKEFTPGDMILIPTQVQAEHINNNKTNQADTIIRGITTGGLVYLVAKKLLGL